MRPAQLDAFLGAAVDALRLMAKSDVRAGPPARLGPLPDGDAVTVAVGVSGALRGSLALTAGRAAAWAVAERILGSETEPGVPVREADVLAVLCELANVAAGRASGRLYELGLPVELTPPAVATGEAADFSPLPGADTVAVPLEADAGALTLLVSLEHGAGPEGSREPGP